MPKKRIKRKRHLVKTGFQFKYLALILLSMLAATAVSVACFYYLFQIILSQQAELPPTIKKITIILAISFLFLVMLFLTLGLILSHRVVGPIHRLERILDEIAQGDFSKRIRFRKKDELHSLAEALNRLLDAIEEKLKKPPT